MTGSAIAGSLFELLLQRSQRGEGRIGVGLALATGRPIGLALVLRRGGFAALLALLGSAGALRPLALRRSRSRGRAAAGGAEAVRLAQETTCQLALIDINTESQVGTRASCLDAGAGRVEIYAANVAVENDVVAVMNQIGTDFGALNGIVNNAGITGRTGVEETTVELWDRVMEVNAKGVFLGAKAAIDALSARGKPWSMVGLSATVAILFGLQGELILANPFVIALIAVPILIQSYGIFALAYGAAYAMRVPHRIAAPCAMIGTSNFFELAVAVAISLFGLNSGAALATVVGVLVEVPVMLSLVAFANRTRAKFA